VEALVQTNKFLEAHSKGPYFLGDQFSIADIALLPFLERFSVSLKHYRGFDIFAVPNTDRIKLFYEKASARPSFQKTSQPASFYIDIYYHYANPEK